MSSQEALIRRVPRGGTRSIRGLTRQLAYLSRQSDPDRDTILLAGSQRHQFAQGAVDAIDPNNVFAFANRLYQRSGRLPPGQTDAVLPSDLTIHFVISFPSGTDFLAAERAGRDWAEYVFGLGYLNERHDYVTAFHCRDGEHPHMHVVVDRSPLDGGNLLILRRGHPHWSYEAMRHWAVEAAANHGIELIATDWSDRSLAERPLTQLQAQELDRRLRERPITLDEHQRRQRAAANASYVDLDFDTQGVAPLDDADEADQLEEDLRRGCTPIVVTRPDTAGPSVIDLDQGDGHDRPIGSQSDLPEESQGSGLAENLVSDTRDNSAAPRSDRDTEQLSQAPTRKRGLNDDRPGQAKKPKTDQTNAGPSEGGASLSVTAANPQRLQRLPLAQVQSGEDRPIGTPHVAENGIADPIVETIEPAKPDADGGGDEVRALGNSAGRTNGLGKRTRDETDDGQANKRQRPNSDSEPTIRGSQTVFDLALEQGAGDSLGSGRLAREPGAQAPSDPLEQRRQAADERRQNAMDALHTHRRKEKPSGVKAGEAYSKEERRLKNTARTALEEQRRAYKGMTNVETRAQAAHRHAPEAERNVDNGHQELRDSRNDKSRSRQITR